MLSKKAKCAILIGGTFNPVTNAHIQMGVLAKRKFQDADIYYIPSNLNFMADWKNIETDNVFNNENRIRLLRQALPDEFKISEIEIEKIVDGTTYHTVLYFKKSYEEVFICMGTDKLNELEKWYRVEELLFESKVLLFTRNHCGFDEGKTPFLKAYRHRFIEMDPNEACQEISSTLVRNAYYRDELASVQKMVPEVVYDFLRKSKEANMFEVEKVTADLIQWTRNWFEENGKGCNAIIGISGGKDSSIAAAICVEALGKDRVIGVLMPNGDQKDIDMARLLVKHLGIRHLVVNINEAYNGVLHAIDVAEKNGMEGFELSSQTKVNLAPRLRMSTLYAVSQSNNGRVINTCNLSEDYVGYSTLYGDAAGDMSLFAELTVAEVKQIGAYLKLPEVLVNKAPSDGLCGKTDEDNLGFTYAVLDRYIRTGVCEDEKVKELIDRKHKANLFKLKTMKHFGYKGDATML